MLESLSESFPRPLLDIFWSWHHAPSPIYLAATSDILANLQRMHGCRHWERRATARCPSHTQRHTTCLSPRAYRCVVRRRRRRVRVQPSPGPSTAPPAPAPAASASSSPVSPQSAGIIVHGLLARTTPPLSHAHANARDWEARRVSWSNDDTRRDSREESLKMAQLHLRPCLPCLPCPSCRRSMQELWPDQTQIQHVRRHQKEDTRVLSVKE